MYEYEKKKKCFIKNKKKDKIVISRVLWKTWGAGRNSLLQLLKLTYEQRIFSVNMKKKLQS